MLEMTRDEECRVWFSPEIEDRNDLWVFDLRDDLRLCLESADELGVVRKLGTDHLDIDLAAHRWLVGAVHVANG